MGNVSGNQLEAMSHRRGGDEDVRVADQFASLVEGSIDVCGLCDDRIGQW
jgi:hypothetical protein